MIDLNHLREQPDLYKNAVKVKGIDLDVAGFLKLDTYYLELLRMVEDLRAEKNSVSKKVPTMKGKEKEDALADMKKLSAGLKEKEEELKNTEESWIEMQLLFPQVPHSTSPVGKDESDNVEIEKWGEPSVMLGDSPPSEPKDHVTLGEALDIIDIPRAVKVAGSRNYFLKGDGARLHLAVLRFALDHLLAKGWTLFTPPLMANWDSFMGMGAFPGIEQLNMYAVGGQEEKDAPIESDDLYLIGTAEVSVVNYHKGEVLQKKTLPTRYCGYSPCFRREAGTYGKDTKGLYRIHNFEKIEQVVLCEADEKVGLEMHKEIRTNAEEVMQALKLPYRIVNCCTGDMGKGKVIMHDIETWMPSRNSYGETHSCSYLGDFQARRLNIKYEDEKGEKKFVHTLNNTCVASPRILIPILEMYQNSDGSVTIPEVLRSYMGGQEKIS